MSEISPSLSVSQLKALEKATGKPFSALLLVKRLGTKTASSGNSFLTVEFGDKTGSFSCTVFSDSPAHDVLRASGEGVVVRLEGRVDYYQGRLAPRLQAAQLIPEEDLLAQPGLLDSLEEAAPESADELWNDLQGFIEHIAHDETRLTVRCALEEIGKAFREAPAAVSMHHAYRHGLLEHTVHMARVCKAILPLYPEVDPSLAMAGILLHDTGKVIEYEGALVPKRSRKGLLQGHVVLGYQIARKAGLKCKLDPDRLERLEHIILSHQGEPEWGAAVYAATPEAVLVSMIDNLDARMGMVQRALRQANPSEPFSERLPGLSTSLLTSPIGGDTHRS